MTPVIASREPRYGASVTDDLAALMPPGTRENRESGLAWIDEMNLLSSPTGMPNAPRIAPLDPPYAAECRLIPSPRLIPSN
jgi:hypothetical protein